MEQVLDEHSFRRWKKKQYLVKWKGYPDSDNQWLDAKDMDNAQELIAEFHNSHPDFNSHIRKALERISNRYPSSSLPQSLTSIHMSDASTLAEVPFGARENTDPLPIPPRTTTPDAPVDPIRAAIVWPTFYRVRDEDFPHPDEPTSKLNNSNQENIPPCHDTTDRGWTRLESFGD